MSSTEKKKAESHGRIVLQVFLTGVAYYVATEIAWALCFPNSKVSLLFPPHAVLVVILLLVPMRHWWAYTLATILAHFVATQQAHWPVLYALHCEAFDAVQNVLVAGGIRLFIKSPLNKITLRDAIVFVLIAVIIVPFGTAFWGAAFTISNGFGTDYWIEWRNLGISNGVTAVVLVPALLLVAERLSRRVSRTKTTRLLEGSLLALGIIIVGAYVFAIVPAGPGTSPALLYAPIPLLIWAALRFGLGGISAAMLVVTFEAIWGAMHGRGPFLLQSPAENALALQMFLIVTGTPLMFLSVLLEDEKRSQQSLGESEGRFQTMADAAPVLIWMSGEDKLCTFFNKAWLEFTGRSLEQELGKGWKEGVHPDDLAKISQTYGHAVDAREPFVMQYRLKNSDGEYRWITDQGVPRYGSRGNFRGYVGACVDITELLEQQRALHEFEERVALAAEAAHLGVWELNTKTNEVWVSDKVRELYQFQPGTSITYEEFQGRIHEEDRALRDTAVQRAIKTQGGYEIEYRILLPDGTVRWIGGRARCVGDEEGTLTRLLGVAMDITERKEAQELFKLATEASPSGTLLVNDRGRIVLVNAHIEELFGYERDELIGKPVEVLVPERFATDHVARRSEFLAAPKVRSADAIGEVSARRKDGTEFPAEVGLNPIQTPRGTLVLATVTDISARKLAEEEARRQHEQINLLTRVSLLGEMTTSLAHELYQPLSAIITNANAGMRSIDKGKENPGTLREILVDVEADGRRAHDIIRNVRNTIRKTILSCGELI